MPVQVLERLQLRLGKRLESLLRVNLTGYDVVIAELEGSVTPRPDAWSLRSVFSRNSCCLVHNQYGYVSFPAFDSQSQLIFQCSLP